MIPSALVHVALYPLNATPRFLACVTGQCLLFEPLLGRGGKQREGGRGLPRSLKSAVDSLPLPFYHPYEAMLSFTSHADLHVASMCLLLWASFWSLLYPSGGGGLIPVTCVSPGMSGTRVMQGLSVTRVSPGMSVTPHMLQPYPGRFFTPLAV